MLLTISLLPKQTGLTAQDLTLCNQFGTGPVDYEIGSAVGKPRATELPMVNFTPGQHIWVRGTLDVDTVLSFAGCIVKMDPGAWIFISGKDGKLRITDGARFFACNLMWRGISNLGGSLQVYDSYFEDAHICFDLKSGTEWTFGSNDFNRNYVGMWINGSTELTEGIYGNRFRFSSALNLPYSGQPQMLGNGRPYCGVQITNSATAIGRINKNANTFDGLQCGIFAENARFNVSNSQFSNMLSPGTNFAGLIGGSGILSVNSRAEVIGANSNRCVFRDNRMAGIRASASNVAVYDADFYRNSTGVENLNTKTGHRFVVERCRFTELGTGHSLSNMSRGILYEKSFSSSTSVIANNMFHTAASTQNFTALSIWAINVIGLTAANSYHAISKNAFESSAPRAVSFIRFLPGPFDNYRIDFNRMKFNTFNNTAARFGIFIEDGTGVDGNVMDNKVQGTDGNISFVSHTCGYHISNTPNLDICRDTSDWGYRGFHFLGKCNREEFRENVINRHTAGLQLDADSEIGKQERTLNKWPYAGAPVGIWSALNQNPDFQSSEFTTHTTAVQFHLTNAIRSPADWFIPQIGPLNGCYETAYVPSLTDFDRSVADGSRVPATALEDWENKHKVYYKLLRFPALAQSEPAVAAFYAQINSNSAGRYAQADYHYWRAAFPPANLTGPLAQSEAVLNTKTDSLNLLYDLLCANEQDTTVQHKYHTLSQEVAALLPQQAQLSGQAHGWVNASLDSLIATLNELPQNTAYEQARAGYLLRASQKMRGNLLSAADLAWLGSIVLDGRDVVGFTAADALRLLPSDDSLHAVENHPTCLAEPGHKTQSGLPVRAAAQPSLRLSPNPAADVVWCSTSGMEGPAHLVVYSALGIQVADKTFASNNPFEVNTQGFPPGTYFCVVQDAAGRMARQRLVVSH